MVYGGSQPETD